MQNTAQKIDFEEKLKAVFQKHVQGQLNEAISDYEELLKSFPDNAELLHRTGMAYFQNKDPLRAEELVKKSIEIAEKPESSYFSNFGIVLQALKKDDEAEDSFRKATETSPEDPKGHFNFAKFLSSHGKDKEAIEHYKIAIKYKPDYVEASHNLIGILIEKEDYAWAEELIEKSLKIKEDDPRLLTSLGLLRNKQGKPEEAKKLFYAMEEKNNDGSGLSKIGLLYKENDKLELAAYYFGKAVEKDKKNAVFFIELANVFEKKEHIEQALSCLRKASENLHESKNVQSKYASLLEKHLRYDAAVDVYRSVYSYDKENIAAYLKAARCLEKCKRYKEAIDVYKKAEELDPTMQQIPAVIGVCYKEIEEYETAIEYFKKSIEIDSEYPEAYGNLANCYKSMEKFEEAIENYKKVIELNPEFVGTYCNLSIVYRELDMFDESFDVLEKARKLYPDHLDVKYQIASTLGKKGDYEESEKLFLDVLKEKETHAPACAGLGSIYRKMNRFDEAIQYYEKAHELMPNNESINMGLGMLNLVVGDFQKAWAGYLDRPTVPRDLIPKREEPLPMDLTNKGILLIRDQGIGDEIFFMRFAKILKERGAEHITYLSNEKLESIIGRIPFIDDVTSKKKVSVKRNYTLSVGDLPYLLDVATAEEICPPVELSPLPDLVEKIKKRLKKAGPPPYIGVTWRAGTEYKGALFKETPLHDMAICLKNVEGTIIALQRLPDDDEIQKFSDILGRQIHDFTDLNDELEEMIALLQEIEAYVTVSNTNVHLREALNRISHVLIPNPPDFRWMSEGPVSPWFPYSRVFRQTADLDWRPAYEELNIDLQSFLDEEKEKAT